MITAPFWKGSGLGNQLFRYIMCRTLAADKGFEFGMEYPENFKGKDFMKINMGVPIKPGVVLEEGGAPVVFPEGIRYYYKEKHIKDHGIDSIDYDPNLLKIKDFTKIDGEFQGENYWGHRQYDIRKWIVTDVLEIPKNVCIINFRGGEYQYVPDLFLPKSYWDEAITLMKKVVPGVKFIVHTDDAVLARSFFPDYEVISNIELNWRSLRYCRYAIVSNSSFSIIPSWLNLRSRKIIAPKFWARRNLGFWHCKYNRYSCFTYL